MAQFSFGRRLFFTFFTTACFAFSTARSVAEKPAQVPLLPIVLSPFFVVPPEFSEEFGAYRPVFLERDPLQENSSFSSEWAVRRAKLLDEWTNRLGTWPPLLTKPDYQILETIYRGKIIQHKVRFRWTPNEWTTGYLLIPPDESPRPAVLSVYYDPETAIGRGEAHRDFAIQLAERGFVTLSIGTTEATAAQTYSLYYPDIDHAQIQPLSMLAYAAANAWFLLADRPEVDRSRIGIIGHSFGGKWAMFAGCLFDKFAAVAVSDPGIMFGTDSNINYWEPWYLGWSPRPWRPRGVITADNPARGLYPQLLAEGRDLHELHALLAPRPFLVSGGEVDPPHRWIALNHLIRLNSLLGYEQRVGMSNRPDHTPNKESNAVIYAFFEHFLVSH